MISIIKNGNPTRHENVVYQAECASCGCVWLTDEVRTIDEAIGCFTVTDCPCCSAKDLPNLQVFNRKK